MRALLLAGRGKPISAILSIGIRLDCRSWLDSEPSMLDETVSEEGGDVEEEKKDGLSERTRETARLPCPTRPNWDIHLIVLFLLVLYLTKVYKTKVRWNFRFCMYMSKLLAEVEKQNAFHDLSPKRSLGGAFSPTSFITGAILTKHLPTNSLTSSLQTLGPSKTAGWTLP
jgi:hypothetical protein